MPTFTLTLRDQTQSYEKDEVRFGRTQDNEVVVSDPASSRSHARIFVHEGRHFVEDLGSGNGTKLNGTKLSQPTELRTGDQLRIGDTIYTFAGPPPEAPRFDQTLPVPGPGDSQTVPPSEPVDANATLLKPPPDFVMPPPAAEQKAVADDETVLKNPPPAAEPVDPNATLLRPPAEFFAKLAPPPAIAVDSHETILKPPPELVQALEKQRAAEAPASIEDTARAPTAPTAAERLREKREAEKSLSGRFAYAWKQMSKPARIITGTVATVFVLGTLGAVVMAVLPRRGPELPPEPQVLTRGERVQASFGVGEGVMYNRRDAKMFEFAAVGATRIVGIIHFQAKDLSKNELSVALNGTELGFVPPDTLEAANREHELVLPAAQMKKGETNILMFDNVLNPPGDDPWRIWNVWLELVALPELGAEEMTALVNEDLQVAARSYEQREIGAENLFRAWKAYRDAWLKLESLPPGSRPDLVYTESRTRLREVGAELDQRCSTMQLEVIKIMGAKRPDYELARTTLQEALRYYPTKEHRCHALLRDMLEQVGGPP
ncbi:MAG: FHA domain-containing protein [Myxococcaceae bacterium]|nr:FHA domain-containing protein [Myxococcaceae bacterium]